MIIAEYLFIFWLGLSLGSFLNAVEYRIRHGGAWWKGRSQCPLCKHTLLWHDLVPLISFLVLRGKCRHCRKSISWQYPLVELWMGLIFVVFVQINGMSFEFIRDAAIVWVLTFIFLYDYKYYEVVTDMVWIVALVLFISSLVFGWNSWRGMVIGALIAGGFFLAQYVVSRGKWVGAGDISLGVFMGVVLGWPLALAGLLITYLIGGAVSSILIIFKKKKLTERTPLGTYIALGILFAMFSGNAIISYIW